MEWYLKVIRSYAVFEGRARRQEYWMFVLFNVIISIGLGLVDLAVFGPMGIGLIRGLYSLAVLLPSIAVGVRRMHDVNKSGWYILIPIYNLVLAATEGDKGANQYGEDPKDPNAQGTSNNDLLDQ